MEPVLNRHRQRIKRAYQNLIHEDGYTPPMLADVLRYKDPGMVYQITNPEVTTLPPLVRHHHAACQLSEDGNTRLGKLGFCGRYGVRTTKPVRINGTLEDERLDMGRAAIEIEQALEASDYFQAELLIDEMQTILDRYRGEVSRAKGSKTNHNTE